MAGLIKTLFERALARQDGMIARLPGVIQDKLADVGEKYAELLITGSEGDIIYFSYKNQRLQMFDDLPEGADGHLDEFYIDGDIYNYSGGDQVLVDVFNGILPVRAAMSHGYFKVRSDRVVYDTEEWAQIFEQFLEVVKLFLSEYLGR